MAFDPETGGVRAETGRRLGAILLAKGNAIAPAPEAIAEALIGGVREHGLDMIAWPEAARRLRARAKWAGINALTDESLLRSLEQWLAPLIAGKRRFSEIEAGALHNALTGLIGWNQRKALDALAPEDFVSPAETTHAIDYGAEGGPTVTLRVQALFGLAEHPCIGPDRTPLILSLTSPAGRPIQTTRDLAGFWRGSWADVAKEMRGAYPKHNWPEDPTGVPASLKTKKVLARER
jgi:ATP-dependent helicase HrpB